MTSAPSFLTFITNTVTNFNNIYADLKSISDRFGADTALSTALAEYAQGLNGNGPRPDLTAAEFDNLKVCIDLLTATLNATNGESVQVEVNTGGAVKLGFYEML